jgi:hypothetical protein
MICFEKLWKTARSASAIGLGLLAVGAAACESSTPDPTDGPTGNACSNIHVERFKELMIVDDAVLEDARAKNASDGVWSFRHAMEQMAPANMDPSEFVRAWLDGWVATPRINGYPVEKAGEARGEGMQREIICPWLKRSPENACDDGCNTCASKKLDLALAPFRLIAIANRMDQRDEVINEPSGEGRFLFSTVKGAGDDPAAEVTNMVIIFEYRLPDTRSLKQWGEAWHALGQFGAFDESYRAALEEVTNGFAKRGASPGAVNGSALAQIRTNEQILHWRWQLREFALDGIRGTVQPRGLRNTPPEELNNSPILAKFLNENAEAVRSSKFEMPDGLRGASATVVEGFWGAPNVDGITLKSFAKNTCNGCHTTEVPTINDRFHVSPYKHGVDKLSAFILNDEPNRPSELTLRTSSLQRALCSE